VFLIGSVLSGISPSMDALIGFRAVQGIGGGMIMALSFVTIGDLFPPSERGKYQGLIAAMFGVSSILGPTLGGALTDNFSWHWIFFVNIPLGIPVVLAFIRYFPNVTIAKKRRIDWAGAALLVAAILPAMLALTWGASSTEWTEPRVIGGFAISAVALVAFLYLESRLDDPLLPLHLFKGRVVGISMVAIFLTGFGMFGAIIFIPLLFQGVLGASATASGSFLTPMMLGMVVGAALSGQALSRTGGHYRIQGVLGLVIMLIGVGMLAAASAETTRAWALSAAVIMGFGLGNTFPVFTIAVQNGVPQRYLGVATSSTQFFRSIGGAIGLAVLGAFMVSRFKSGLAASLPPEAFEKVTRGAGENPNALVDPAPTPPPHTPVHHSRLVHQRGDVVGLHVVSGVGLKDVIEIIGCASPEVNPRPLTPRSRVRSDAIGQRPEESSAETRRPSRPALRSPAKHKPLPHLADRNLARSSGPYLRSCAIVAPFVAMMDPTNAPDHFETPRFARRLVIVVGH